MDYIPGEHNPSDVLMKHAGLSSGIFYKTGVLCGSTPILYDTAAVLVVLDNEKRNR